MIRIAAFIDGYNLYHGVAEADDGKHRCWLWVDLHELVRRISPKTDTEIVAVNYYTAEAKSPASRDHQDAFVSANKELHPQFRPVWGFMKATQRPCGCQACVDKGTMWVEKRSDVNLAVDMVMGGTKAVPDYDIAVLITGDADQVASVVAVQNAGRKVIVAFPPDRPSDALRDACNIETIPITSTMLRRAQMQESVMVAGRVKARPPVWPKRPGSFPES